MSKLPAERREESALLSIAMKNIWRTAQKKMAAENQSGSYSSSVPPKSDRTLRRKKSSIEGSLNTLGPDEKASLIGKVLNE